MTQEASSKSEDTEQAVTEEERSVVSPTSSVGHHGGVELAVDHSERHEASSNHTHAEWTVDLVQSWGVTKATRALERCNQLYQSGAYGEAERGYRVLIEARNDEKLLANLGYSLQAQGRHEDAVELFERYLETFIGRHHAWKALCFSHYHLKDYESMTRCAREAIRWDIRLDTPDDYSWQQMATAHFLMGDLSTALKAARKSSQINPQNAYALYYQACVITAVSSGADCDHPELFETPPSIEEAAERLCDALEARPDLEVIFLSEGYLDEAFTLLPQIREARLAILQVATEEQEPQAEDDARETGQEKTED